MELSELRAEIDQIDAELVALYRRRMETVTQISAYKRLHDLPVYDPQREQALLKRVGEMAGPDHADGARAMFTLIMAWSRAFQERERSNIVLIGMPGCGKSTVGRVVAQKLGRPFVSTDDMIERRAGMTCGDYLRRYGEADFRLRETEAVREAAERMGCVIATGGGTVTRAENIELLKRSGVLFYLRRPLDQLDTSEDRPLSATPEKLRRLWQERAPLYLAARDYEVEGEGWEVKAEAVIALWRKHFSP